MKTKRSAAEMKANHMRSGFRLCEMPMAIGAVIRARGALIDWMDPSVVRNLLRSRKLVTSRDGEWRRNRKTM
jgi:hypothetical protein